LKKEENYEDSTNFMNFLPDQYESSMIGSNSFEEEKNCKQMEYETLKEENTINLNFLQCSNDSPSWQLEDYFML